MLFIDFFSNGLKSWIIRRKNQNIGGTNGKSIGWWMAKKWRVRTISRMFGEKKCGRKANSTNVATIFVVEVRQISFSLIFHI